MIGSILLMGILIIAIFCAVGYFYIRQIDAEQEETINALRAMGYNVEVQKRTFFSNYSRRGAHLLRGYDPHRWHAERGVT